MILFFQSMGEENRHDGVLLLNEHGGLCVLFRDFGIRIIPLNKKKIIINELAEKKIEQ